MKPQRTVVSGLMSIGLVAVCWSVLPDVAAALPPGVGCDEFWCSNNTGRSQVVTGYEWCTQVAGRIGGKNESVVVSVPAHGRASVPDCPEGGVAQQVFFDNFSSPSPLPATASATAR
jgi:hypothetical protein